MMMLELEYIFVDIIVKVDARLLCCQPGLCRTFLGHEGRSTGRLGNLDPRQPRFLKTAMSPRAGNGNIFQILFGEM